MVKRVVKWSKRPCHGEFTMHACGQKSQDNFRHELKGTVMNSLI